MYSKFLFFFLLLLNALCFSERTSETIREEYQKALQEEGALLFTPPSGWVAADPRNLSKRVKMMVIGKSKKNYPPSISLGTEPFSGTLKEYLHVVKTVNEAQGSPWKNLGIIKTAAGPASLSQFDMQSEWGIVRVMHVILVKGGQVYVLSAGALKEEFHLFYHDFFQAMTSIRFNPKHTHNDGVKIH